MTFALIVVVNKTTAEPTIEISPTIRLKGAEFFLGERVACELGKHTSKQVAGPWLASADCVLKVVRPDGKEFLRKEGRTQIYNGPTMVSSLFHTELLNDLIDR